MSIGVIVVVAVIAVIMIFGLRKTVKTVKGGCCGGGGGGELKPLEKHLDGEVKSVMDIDVEGMSCINCQYRVQRSLDKIDGVVSDVSWKKHNARVSMDRDVSEESLVAAVEDAGYHVKTIQTVNA